jgi:hypothetical protein
MHRDVGSIESATYSVQKSGANICSPPFCDVQTDRRKWPLCSPDLQAGRGRREKLASPQWPQPVAENNSRCKVHRRNSKPRKLKPADPEYAQVGLTEAKARETHDAVVAVVRFDETTRTIIDGRTAGFCKLIADRATRAILGCHVVGERAVEIVQVVAVAIAAGMRVDDLARVPLSFPLMPLCPGARHTVPPSSSIWE